MRVIGGEYRRRHLMRPGRGSAGIRSTYDSVRENVFNLIGNRVNGASFLDLFAGTGCVGIEALSRGAAECVFVDSSRESLSLIRENCRGLGISRERYEIIAGDVGVFLKRDSGKRFDIVFLDPPYAGGLFEESMAILGGFCGLKEDCLVVGQHGGPAGGERFGELLRFDERKYGKTWISLWRTDF